MNHLIAKIKGHTTTYKKILSDQTIYNMPEDLTNPVPYSPNHNLDEEKWFCINDFQQNHFCLDFLRQDFNSTAYDMILSNDMGKIDFICSYQGSTQYHFQKVTPNSLLCKKFLYLGDSVEFKENMRHIIIKNVPDAIYIKNDDILYFKMLSAITSIFKGIVELYREATSQEVTTFLSNDFISLTGGFSTEKVKIPNRRRIAMVVDTLNRFTVLEKRTVFEYINEYCPNLLFENQAFKIATEEDLKALLYGIEQRYFTTPVGNERRLANSIISL